MCPAVWPRSCFLRPSCRRSLEGRGCSCSQDMWPPRAEGSHWGLPQVVALMGWGHWDRSQAFWGSEQGPEESRNGRAIPHLSLAPSGLPGGAGCGHSGGRSLVQLFAQLRFNLQNRKACIDTSHSHRRNWASCLPGSAAGPLPPSAGSSLQTTPSNIGASSFPYPHPTRYLRTISPALQAPGWRMGRGCFDDQGMRSRKVEALPPPAPFYK